jgi:DNA-binding response OmpR family regulator
VLTEIRERGFDCRVTMVTAVDPDFDIVDMPFDDYVSKPVDDDELRAVIESLLELDEYDETLNDLYAVSRKIATLEDQMPRQSLDENERYARLHEQREELLTEADDFVTELDLEENPEFFDVPDAERPQ